MMTAKLSHKILVAFLCTFLAFSTAACSTNPGDGYKSGQISDPIEPVNRAIFAVNNVLDRFIIEPVAKIYHAIFPDFVRDGVQNFMRNLKSPLIVANSLLQGDFSNAGVATARFVINTTAGIGGLVDVASAQGLPYQPEDLGQTMAVWGMGDGFYIVLPILGPSSLRDTAGLVGDTLADPVRIWAHNTDNDWIYYTRGAIEGIDNRARMLRAIEDLRRNSLDYYAAVRSAYGQKRQALIRNESPDAAPDYDEFQ
jgi:phospholipid-binding lipoprotein MlaA